MPAKKKAAKKKKQSRSIQTPRTIDAEIGTQLQVIQAAWATISGITARELARLAGQ